MAVKIKKSAGASAVIKKTAIGAAVGFGVSVLLSLITAAAALKTKDPLSMADTLAALCVLGGAMAAAIFGCRAGKGFLPGCYTGLAYTLVYVLLSLCMGDGGGKPFMLFGAAVLGTLGGCALAKGKKPSTRKRIKKYVKR